MQHPMPSLSVTVAEWRPRRLTVALPGGLEQWFSPGQLYSEMDYGSALLWTSLWQGVTTGLCQVLDTSAAHQSVESWSVHPAWNA